MEMVIKEKLHREETWKLYIEKNEKLNERINLDRSFQRLKN